MPRCFGAVGVRPGQEDPEVAEVRARGPHLLAVDDPLVAVALGSCRQPGEVGAGAGLAEELAPHLLAAEHRSEVALLLRVGSVGDDRGTRHAHPDGEGVAEHPGARRLLGEDRGLGRGAASPAVLGGPRDARPSFVGEEPLPSLGPRDPVELVAGHRATPPSRGPRRRRAAARTTRGSPLGRRSPQASRRSPSPSPSVTRE